MLVSVSRRVSSQRETQQLKIVLETKQTNPSVAHKQSGNFFGCYYLSTSHTCMYLLASLEAVLVRLVLVMVVVESVRQGACDSVQLET